MEKGNVNRSSPVPPSTLPAPFGASSTCPSFSCCLCPSLSGNPYSVCLVSLTSVGQLLIFLASVAFVAFVFLAGLQVGLLGRAGKQSRQVVGTLLW